MIYEIKRLKWLKEEIENIEDLLEKNNIKYKKISILKKRKFKENCFNNFVKKEQNNIENKYTCLGDTSRSSYMWHLFSFNLLPTYTPIEAIKRYDEIAKKESYILINIDGISDVVFKITNTDKLNSELCKYFDIVVIDVNYQWIFARTHEEYMENKKYYNGPYFYEKSVDNN